MEEDSMTEQQPHSQQEDKEQHQNQEEEEEEINVPFAFVSLFLSFFLWSSHLCYGFVLTLCVCCLRLMCDG